MNLIKAIKRAVPARYKPLNYLQSLVERRTRHRVRSGPFEGQMVVFRNTQYSMYIPKVLGLYERELHSTVEEICERAPSTIINVGAGDGYYAVGFSQRLPSANIIAFETDPHARENLARNALLNGVADHIQIHGPCGVTELREALLKESRPTIICDVEGFEMELLNPTSILALNDADILVETHDFIVPGVTRLIEDRFSASHDIRSIEQEQRSAADFPWRTPVTALMSNRYLELVVSEGRPETMTWLWMKARSGN